MDDSSRVATRIAPAYFALSTMSSLGYGNSPVAQNDFEHAYDHYNGYHDYNTDFEHVSDYHDNSYENKSYYRFEFN